MTIGTVRVAPSAACRVRSVPSATSTLTFDRTSSAASADSALNPLHAPKSTIEILAVPEAMDLQFVEEGLVNGGAERCAGFAPKKPTRALRVGRLPRRRKGHDRVEPPSSLMDFRRLSRSIACAATLSQSSSVADCGASSHGLAALRDRGPAHVSWGQHRRSPRRDMVSASTSDSGR